MRKSYSLLRYFFVILEQWIIFLLLGRVSFFLRVSVFSVFSIFEHVMVPPFVYIQLRLYRRKFITYISNSPYWNIVDLLSFTNIIGLSVAAFVFFVLEHVMVPTLWPYLFIFFLHQLFSFFPPVLGRAPIFLYGTEVLHPLPWFCSISWWNWGLSH